MKTRLIITAAVLIIAATAALLLPRPESPPPGPTSPTATAQPPTAGGAVSGFVAPTLIAIAKAAASKAGLDPGGIRSVGSVEGLRLIQQGNVPDVYASVDIELLPDIKKTNPRQVFVIGRFNLTITCLKPLRDVADLLSRRQALADPYKAPIGYRTLAAGWLLKKQGAADLTPLYEELGVRYAETPRGVNITTPIALKNTPRVVVAPNLDGAWAQLETGGADCAFAYTPFLINKGVEIGERLGETALWVAYRARASFGEVYVYSLKPPLSFAEDPPYEIYVIFLDAAGNVVKTLRVGRFEAFAASYTERGDRVLEAMKSLDLASFGFTK